MIEAIELRIGNYVQDNNAPFRIKSVDRSSVEKNDDPQDTKEKDEQFPSNQNSQTALPLKDLKPIPLTKEILMKAGFEPYNVLGLYDGSWRIKTNQHYFVVSLLNKSFFANLYFQVKIPSVHKLQNLYYSLTGEELAVVL